MGRGPFSKSKSDTHLSSLVLTIVFQNIFEKNQVSTYQLVVMLDFGEQSKLSELNRLVRVELPLFS